MQHAVALLSTTERRYMRIVVLFLAVWMGRRERSRFGGGGGGGGLLPAHLSPEIGSQAVLGVIGHLDGVPCPA